MIGYSLGARDREDMRIAGNTVLMLCLVSELIFAGIFFAFHKSLPLLYTSNAEVISLASTMLVLAAFFQISDGLQAVAAGALRGMQDVRYPAVIAFVSYWLVMIPACYILAFPMQLGLRGLGSCCEK
jgi:MATE family multidrug resistance protein